MKEKKKVLMISFIVILMVSFLFISCEDKKERSVFTYAKWKIVVNYENNSFDISYGKIGKLFEGVKIYKEDGDFLNIKDVKFEKDELEVKSHKGETFKFIITEDSLIFKFGEAEYFLEGKAFANEKRIFARTKEENNNIMYASLGPVYSTFFNKLFDVSTDTLIIFPEVYKMSRQRNNPDFLNLSLKIKDGSKILLVKDYYKKIGLKFYKPKREYFYNAPVGWSSWYSYYMKANEKALVRESDAVSKYFKDFGMEYIQLDACYTRGKDANYLSWTKETFPHGGKWIFNYIRKKGLKPALWINLYGSNYEKAEVMERYPDNFYLKDKNGKLSGACCTADDTVKRLDYSNPEVIKKHLIPMLKILKEEWGLTYLKDAGWGTWIDYYEKNRENAYNPEKDSREIYLEVQKAARNTLGDDIYMLGCAMHEVGLGFGIYDGSRIGDDDKAVWYPEKKNGFSMQIFFHSLFGGEFLNNVVWHSDPDAVMVRKPLTYEEGKTIVSSIGLLGQLYMASDFMGELPSEKIELYRKTIPTAHILPVDLYPFNAKPNTKDGVLQCCPRLEKFPKAIDLKVSFLTGSYDVLAIYNWADNPEIKELSFSEIGLTGDSYLLFDFWDEKLLDDNVRGYKGKISAHGVKVLIVREKTGVPLLITTSRHITGTVSIKKFKEWNGKSIEGVSNVPDDYEYKLFFYLPRSFKMKNIITNSVTKSFKMEGNLLIVNLKGKKSLKWTIFFEKQDLH